MSVQVKRFHRSWHMEQEVYMSDKDQVRPEFLDLYKQFRRNRVWLQLEREGDVNEDEEERIAKLLEVRIVNSLENQCTGFWTVDFDEEEKGKEDSISLFIMFEKEEDLERYLSNDGLMFRLEL